MISVLSSKCRSLTASSLHRDLTWTLPGSMTQGQTESTAITLSFSKSSGILLSEVSTQRIWLSSSLLATNMTLWSKRRKRGAYDDYSSYKLCIKPHILWSMHFIGMFDTVAMVFEVTALTSEHNKAAIEEVVTNVRKKSLTLESSRNP